MSFILLLYISTNPKQFSLNKVHLIFQYIIWTRLELVHFWNYQNLSRSLNFKAKLYSLFYEGYEILQN